MSSEFVLLEEKIIVLFIEFISKLVGALTVVAVSLTNQQPFRHDEGREEDTSVCIANIYM